MINFGKFYFTILLYLKKVTSNSNMAFVQIYQLFIILPHLFYYMLSPPLLSLLLPSLPLPSPLSLSTHTHFLFILK